MSYPSITPSAASNLSCLSFYLFVCGKKFGDKLPGVGIQAGEAYKWLLCAAALIIKPATTSLRDFSPG